VPAKSGLLGTLHAHLPALRSGMGFFTDMYANRGVGVGGFGNTAAGFTGGGAGQALDGYGGGEAGGYGQEAGAEY